MDINTIIQLIAAGTTLLTVLGGGSIFYISITKQLKQAEVKDKNVDIELKEADAWKDLYEKSQERANKKSETIHSLYEKLNEKDRTINEKEAEILRLKYEKEMCDKEHQFRERQLQWNECRVNGCIKRHPPREHETPITSTPSTEEKS